MRIFLLLFLLVSGCATQSDYFQGCYEGRIDLIRGENQQKFYMQKDYPKEGYVFGYQKRYTEAVCQLMDDERAQERARNREHGPKR